MSYDLASSTVTDLLVALFLVPKVFGKHHWYLCEAIIASLGALSARFSHSHIFKVSGLIVFVVAILQANCHFDWSNFFQDYQALDSTITFLNFLGVIFLPLALLTPDGAAWIAHVHAASPIKFTRQAREGQGVSLA